MEEREIIATKPQGHGGDQAMRHLLRAVLDEAIHDAEATTKEVTGRCEELKASNPSQDDRQAHLDLARELDKADVDLRAAQAYEQGVRAVAARILAHVLGDDRPPPGVEETTAEARARRGERPQH